MTIHNEKFTRELLFLTSILSILSLALTPIPAAASPDNNGSEQALQQHFVYLPLVENNPPRPLCNGDFEAGRTCWLESSRLGYDVIWQNPSPFTSHSGSWVAWLGGVDSERSALQQLVTIPSNTPYLAYWYWIDSTDACGKDFSWVSIDTTLIEQTDLCTGTSTTSMGGWVHQVVDTSAFAGQTVFIRIVAETDAINPSDFLIDDVTFQASLNPLPVR